jgi:hypothetical protein
MTTRKLLAASAVLVATLTLAMEPQVGPQVESQAEVEIPIQYLLSGMSLGSLKQGGDQ